VVLQKLKRYGVPQSDVVYYYEAVIRPVMEYARQVRHTSLTSEQSKHLKQFSDNLVKSLLEAVHTAVTLLLLRWTAFILGMVELCTKNLQIMRNDFTDYARTFCQLCANYAHFLPIMRTLCALFANYVQIMRNDFKDYAQSRIQ